MLRRQVNQPIGRRTTATKTMLQKKVQEMRRVNRSLEQELNDWERRLRTVADDAQLTTIDLQNMLQKQQQTLQVLSNISKVMYNTAMSAIRNLK